MDALLAWLVERLVGPVGIRRIAHAVAVVAAIATIAFLIILAVRILHF